MSVIHPMKFKEFQALPLYQKWVNWVLMSQVYGTEYTQPMGW